MSARGPVVITVEDVARGEAERLVVGWLRHGGVEVRQRLRDLAYDVARRSFVRLPEVAEADGILRAAIRDGAWTVARRPAVAVARAAAGGRVEGTEPAPPREHQAEALTWIEVQLVDEVGAPVAGARYEITLPDGSTRRGILNAQGVTHLRGIDPGVCEFTFTELDTDAWAEAPVSGP